MGGLHQFAPYVLGPSGIPKVTDETQACENPELAVLSAMAHGRDADSVEALEIAQAAHRASEGLDANRACIYLDLIISSLGEAARRALGNMDARKYEFQSDFARHYIAEGEARGRTSLLIRLLTSRFGPIDSQTEGRVRQASIAELEAIGESLLTPRTLQEALGAP